MFHASNTSIYSRPSNYGQKRYMPGLDGLRALSVLAVIAYHLKLPWAPGGLLGVGIFFTLSGYLITDQLMMEWQRARRFDLKRFWMRRVRRLLPAMFFMLALVSLWLYCFDRPRLISLQGDFLSAIFYFNNWWLIFHQVSYFKSFGPPSPIGHLWSLAIEEQFYILWPLLLALIMRWIPRRGLQTFIILMGAVASAAAMALIYQPGTDPSRVYYGTDTRAFALLIGAGLATIWPSRDLSSGFTGKSKIIPDLMGGAGLLAIILIMGCTNEYDPSLYKYGLAVFAILSAIVIAALAYPASMLSKILGCKPLRWLGVRSYSLYLWHYPVITLTNPAIDTGDFNIGRVALQLVLTILLAAISWRFIEEPILNGHLRPLRAISPSRTIKTRYAFITVVSLLILMIIPGCFNIMQDKILDSPSASAEGNTDKRLLASGSQVLLTSDGAKQATVDLPDQKPPVDIESTKSVEVHSGQGITAIGDSVMLDVAPNLGKLLPGIFIDGEVGRQMYQAQAVVDRLKAEGKLGKIVIIELGTNGSFSEKQLMSLLTSLEEVKQIVLVNTRVPKPWQDTVNNDLQKAVDEIPNTVLVDWFSASKGHDSYFNPDGVHLTPEGASNYADMLSQAIYKDAEE